MPAQIGILDAAAPGHNPDTGFNKAHYRIGVDDKPVAMRQHLIPAASSKAGRGTNNRHGRIFQLEDRILESGQERIDTIPVRCLNQ